MKLASSDIWFFHHAVQPSLLSCLRMFSLMFHFPKWQQKPLQAGVPDDVNILVWGLQILLRTTGSSGASSPDMECFAAIKHDAKKKKFHIKAVHDQYHRGTQATRPWGCSGSQRNNTENHVKTEIVYFNSDSMLDGSSRAYFFFPTLSQDVQYAPHPFQA